jgi:anaphase-promoting complex subunit 3
LAQQQQQSTASPANAEVVARLQTCAKASTALWSFDSAEARASLNGFAPGNPWAMEHAGLAAFHAGDMATAVANFRTLLESHPWRADREWVVTYSTALWFAKKDAALGALAQRMISHYRHSAFTMCVVGNAYSLASNAASAHAMFQRATLIDPTFAYAHTLCGHEAMALGQREQAAENFRKALNCDPRHYSAFAGIGDFYTKSEALPNARAHLQQAIQINPLPVIMNRLAATYHAQGFASESDLRNALSVYDQVLYKHPRNFAATHQRATVLLRLGHVETALESLERLSEEVGEDAALHMTLGHCNARLGRTTKAIASFRRAADLDPRRAQAAKTQIERLGAK